MRMLPRLSCLALLVCACGGGGGNDPGGGSGTRFTAKIDAQSWQADALSISAQAVPGVPGGVIVVGSQSAGGVSRGLTLTLFNMTGPGTFPLGVGSDVFGGTGSVGEGTGSGGSSQTWITDNTGTAGTITLTTLGGGRIAGTFSYVATPGHSNTVGGTRTVTEGSFDLPFTGNLTPVPANVGSRLSAQLGGQAYNASTVTAVNHDPLGGTGVQLGTVSKDHGLSITLYGVGAPGTYPLVSSGTARLMGAGHNGGDANHCCWGGGNSGGDVGSVVITSLTTDRVQGTFSATLQPVPGKPATSALTVSSGSFDVGFTH